MHPDRRPFRGRGSSGTRRCRTFPCSPSDSRRYLRKGPIKLAFNAASEKYSRYGVKKDDNLIEWMEFRIFLVYLRQYFEYWIMFDKVDNSGDHLINLEEFKKAIPQMKNWGVEISEAEAEKEFKSIDTNNGGAISFEEFCSFAIQKSLDLEEDDGFDDEELKNLK